MPGTQSATTLFSHVEPNAVLVQKFNTYMLAMLYSALTVAQTAEES